MQIYLINEPNKGLDMWEFLLYVGQQEPKEIYAPKWNKDLPFMVIYEYNGAGLRLRCNATNDCETTQWTASFLYEHLRRLQEYGDFYIAPPGLSRDEIAQDIETLRFY